jgi:hypothetical protein
MRLMTEAACVAGDTAVVMDTAREESYALCVGGTDLPSLFDVVECHGVAGEKFEPFVLWDAVELAVDGGL